MRNLILLITTLFIVSCSKNNTQPLGAFIAYKNMRYGTADSNQNMDVYLPKSTNKAFVPVIIMIHGGGWFAGSKADFDGLGIYEIFTGSGYAVVNMNYRLAPQNIYPDPLDDVDAVIKILRQNESKWRINTAHICLMGRSSGGQIALQYAYTRNINGYIKTAVDFFGIPDIVDTSDMAPRLTPQIADYMGSTYSTAPQSWYDASPIHHVKTAVPTAIFHGSIDDTVYPIESENLKDSLQANGIPYLYFVRVGWAHGFDAPTWENSAGVTVEWISHFMFN